MHDEDKRNGLLVRNIRGDTWWAYGDANFFDERNAQNVAMVAEAAQISRNEIWSAFQGAVDVFGAVNLIPDVNRSEEHTSELQSLMRISYAVFCLQQNTHSTSHKTTPPTSLEIIDRY